MDMHSIDVLGRIKKAVASLMLPMFILSMPIVSIRDSTYADENATAIGLSYGRPDSHEGNMPYFKALRTDRVAGFAKFLRFDPGASFKFAGGKREDFLYGKASVQLNFFLNVYNKSYGGNDAKHADMARETAYWLQDVIAFQKIGNMKYEKPGYSLEVINDNQKKPYIKGAGTWIKFDNNYYYIDNGASRTGHLHNRGSYIAGASEKVINGKGVEVLFEIFAIHGKNISRWKRTLFIHDKNIKSASFEANPAAYEDFEFVLGGLYDGRDVSFKSLYGYIGMFYDKNGRMTEFPKYASKGYSTGESTDNVNVGMFNSVGVLSRGKIGSYYIGRTEPLTMEEVLKRELGRKESINVKRETGF